jgi:hypothetical protein
LAVAIDVAASSHDDYWTRRRAVLIAATWAADRFEKAQVLENQARAGIADSLLAAARAWSLPDWLQQAARSRPFTVCVAHVTDRTESRYPATVHLPGWALSLLTRDLFPAWMSVLSSADSLFSGADFAFAGSRSVWRYSENEKYPNLLNQPAMQQRRRFGLLHTSPGKRWVLDPFVGAEIDSTGRLGSDVDRGFCVYDMSTGNLTYYDVSTVDGIVLATWANDSTFVLAGTAAVDLRCDLPMRAPAFWIGDTGTGRLTTYLGVPFSPWSETKVWEGWRHVAHKAYPKIRSFP